MWPRLVASKVIKRLGSTNFVADFPSDNSEYLLEIPPHFDKRSVSSDDIIFNHDLQETQNYRVFVNTWNVGGVVPTDDFNVDDLLNTCHTSSCDIYVFGFQEVVPLRATNVLGSESGRILAKWNCLIREALNKKGKENNIGNNGKLFPQEFNCIISKQMVGILISVWVRNDLQSFIKNPSVSCVGCGIMGCLGNKGAVSVRFQLHQTSLCFVCSHLASGGREGDEKNRNSNVGEIFSRATFPKGPSLQLPTKILDHDRVIFLGDLNYRISLPESTTRLLVEKGEWNALLEKDQLRMELMDGQVFEGWQEGIINFAPTYKYYPNSSEYYGRSEVKRGEKKRSPAWCDRIIWYGEGLKQQLYDRGESKLSDHRPVKAIFSTQIRVSKKLKKLQTFFLSERFEKITSHLEDALTKR
ncbi:type IV inositol polyphosphate 5-phosphatase 9 isoform X2 [Solanum verrucosum]|uniref:type IV inositol polyphosphate 5-phosphatase 9 isoform X2 n=1 Tax=Solanum verrucosum TaxID=315347 RepID=UPI0020D070E5|nr:type IV inositol polyphosphate 5-phosphatase 9 isoform X2 [Solanum verrucosum]